MDSGVVGRAAAVLLLLVAGPGLAWAPAAPRASAQTAEPKAVPGARLIAAPWRSLPPARLHAVKASALRRGLLYSGTRSGLFVSDDDGESWGPVAVGGSHSEVFCLVVHPDDPDTLTVGRRDGLWRSHDGGKRWAGMTAPVSGQWVPLTIAVAPSQPRVVFLATARHGIYRSDDGGVSWSGVGKGLPEAAAGARPEEIRSLVVHPLNPDEAYVAHERHGVYRTADGGATWRPFNAGLRLSIWRLVGTPRLAFDPDDPRRLYLVVAQAAHSRLVRNRLFFTSRSGEWLPLEVTLPINTRIDEVTADGGSRALRLWADGSVWELSLPDPPKVTR